MSNGDLGLRMVQRFVFYGLLVVVALAPLPLGANRPWSWSLLSLCVAILVLVDGIWSFIRPEKGAETLQNRLWWPSILFGLIVIWTLVQALPDILPGISHPMWSEAQAQLGLDIRSAISVNPALTFQASMLLLTYGGIFWLSMRYGRDRKNASKMLKFFVVSSTAYAIYGLIVFFGGWEKVLWYDKEAYHNDLTSTFINHNNYATYAAIGLIASVVLLVNVLAGAFKSNASKRELFRRLSDQVLTKAWLPTLGVLSTGSALILAHSRAGFVAAMVGLGLALVGLLFSRMLPKKLAIWSCVGLVGLCLGGYSLSGEILDQRYGRLDDDVAKRLAVYEGTLNGIELSPLVGYGYGAFEPGFRAFKKERIASNSWKYAHNSYLEFAFGAGVVALLVMVGTILALLVRQLIGIRSRRRDQIYPIIGAAACVTVAVHSILDFSIQIPGMGVAFLFVFGLGWSQSWSQGHRRKQ